MSQTILDGFVGEIAMPSSRDESHKYKVRIGGQGEFITCQCWHGSLPKNKDRPCRHYLEWRLKLTDQRIASLELEEWSRKGSGTETLEDAMELFDSYRGWELNILTKYAILICLEKGEYAVDDLHILRPAIAENRERIGYPIGDFRFLGAVNRRLMGSRMMEFKERRNTRDGRSHSRKIDVLIFTRTGFEEAKEMSPLTY